MLATILCQKNIKNKKNSSIGWHGKKNLIKTFVTPVTSVYYVVHTSTANCTDFLIIKFQTAWACFYCTDRISKRSVGCRHRRPAVHITGFWCFFDIIDIIDGFFNCFKFYFELILIDFKLNHIKFILFANHLLIFDTAHIPPRNSRQATQMAYHALQIVLPRLVRFSDLRFHLEAK